jgi:prophage regulatory protein
MPLPNFDELPDGALIRKRTLLGSVVPVSNTTLWRMVRENRFPRPIPLSEDGRCPAWKVGDVRAWLAEREAAAKVGALQ